MNEYLESKKYFRSVLRGIRRKDAVDQLSISESKSSDFDAATIKGYGHEFSLNSYWSAGSHPRRRLWFFAKKEALDIRKDFIYGPDEIERDLQVQKERFLKGTTVALEAEFLGYLISEKLEEYLSRAPSRQTLLRKESGKHNSLRFTALSALNSVVSKYGEEVLCEAMELSKNLMPELKITPRVSCKKYSSDLRISVKAQGQNFFLEAMVLHRLDGTLLSESWSVLDAQKQVIFPKTVMKDQVFLRGNASINASVIAETLVNSIKSNLGILEGESAKPGDAPRSRSRKSLSFETEVQVIEHKFDPKIIFSSLDHISRVPEAVLNLYSFSDQDAEWVKSLVARELQGKWVSWDNREAILIHFMRINFKTADWYFAKRFPLFSKVANKFYKAGSYPTLTRRLFHGETTIHAFRTDAFVLKRDEFLDRVRRLIVSEGEEQRDALIEKAYGLSPEDWRKSVGNLWQPLGPRPIIPPGGLTPKEAETHVSQILNFYGLAGTKVTRYSRDGGVDVESDRGVFQVKHQIAPVGVGVVREILGVAASKGKRAGVFAKIGFTKEATEFANKNGIVLFSYTPTLQGKTKNAEALLNSGFETF